MSIIRVGVWTAERSLSKEKDREILIFAFFNLICWF